MTETMPHNAAGGTDRINMLAIIGFVVAFPVGIVGAVISVVALAEVRRKKERGTGLAVAGIVIGSFWVVFFAIALIIHAVVVLK